MKKYFFTILVFFVAGLGHAKSQKGNTETEKSITKIIIRPQKDNVENLKTLSGFNPIKKSGVITLYCGPFKRDASQPPIFYSFNGIIMDAEYSIFDIDDVDSVKYLPGAIAIKKYGKAVQSGIMEFVLKGNEKKNYLLLDTVLQIYKIAKEYLLLQVYVNKILVKDPAKCLININRIDSLFITNDWWFAGVIDKPCTEKYISITQKKN